MKELRGHMRKAVETGTPQAALFYSVLGVLFAVLLLLIGFWKTMLVTACSLAGVFIGGIKDKPGFIRRMVGRVYRGSR